MVSMAGNQAAPGALEDVRALLNSWLVPNETRVAEDRFPEFAAQHAVLDAERDDLLRLRDDLRAAVEGSADSTAVLNDWIDRLGIRPQVVEGSIAYRHEGGLAGALVAACLDALGAGRWHRLKSCPDCRWVFYDHTRNAGKRWCLMTAGGPDGRSCGSIAKVRAFRNRQRMP
jgi:predicted RNA-binding Zn ribbon-like protein